MSGPPAAPNSIHVVDVLVDLGTDLEAIIIMAAAWAGWPPTPSPLGGDHV